MFLHFDAIMRRDCPLVFSFVSRLPRYITSSINLPFLTLLYPMCLA